MGYAVGGDDNKTQKRSVGSAIKNPSQTPIAKDEMNGGAGERHESLRMSEGNILEAHGRDVSNSKADVDGWGGPDAPYRGMATDAPYGAGAGLKGSRSKD